MNLLSELMYFYCKICYFGHCIYRPGPTRGARLYQGGGPPGPTLATALGGKWPQDYVAAVTAHVVAAEATNSKGLEFERQLSIFKYFMTALRGRGS